MRPDPMPDEHPDEQDPPKETGGPYFGRLLLVLFLAVAFCGVLTWLLGKWYE